MSEIRITLDATPGLAAALEALLRHLAAPQPAAVPAPAPAVTPALAPAPAPAPAPVAAVAPLAPAHEFTYQEIATAATGLADAGKRDEVIALIQSFGVQAISQIPKTKAGEFVTALREMGAKI